MTRSTQDHPPITFTEQHGYWLRGRSHETDRHLGKALIAVRMQAGVVPVRLFTERDQADAAWREVLRGTITVPEMQARPF